MLEKITSADPLWADPPFASDGATFALMYKLCQMEDGLFLTDRHSVVLAQTHRDLGAWVWTAEDIAENTLAALHDACVAHDIIVVTARPGIGARLLDDGIMMERLLGYECREVIVPNGIVGCVDRPTAMEGALIAGMFSGFMTDIGTSDDPAEVYTEDAARALEDPYFMVWRDMSGEAVAIARMQKRGGPYATISFVYTRPEARGHGYAGALVAHLTRRALDEGFIPMLYTNADYPSSNRAYRKIGFTETGLLEKMKRV